MGTVKYRAKQAIQSEEENGSSQEWFPEEKEVRVGDKNRFGRDRTVKGETLLNLQGHINITVKTRFTLSKYYLDRNNS